MSDVKKFSHDFYAKHLKLIKHPDEGGLYARGRSAICDESVLFTAAQCLLCGVCPRVRAVFRSSLPVQTPDRAGGVRDVCSTIYYFITMDDNNGHG